ncbi:DNA polymerase III subunit gamma/tau [Frisingicoccus sp.]|uniref:DNA polymerase III subunit gamma/tau n=1 Tax=Frisingicoccus sp. TaxID=1918627 RepID=UPI003AB91873
MSYQALYRKWRPQTFEDVKGQEHIVTTLKNQIRLGRVGHAYLFCGTRGTGKTSVAKIFAKAVNCLQPVDGSPCGECAMCRAIQSQTLMNVIEIDAASNNGIDNIREIRDEVEYSPTEGRYKVYIIDEVHMLSIGAFNALLKTLEEPPEYVIFILATTEAHKIPVTILSRCQRYDFRRITVDTITGRLTELAEKENLDVEEKALRYIARAADGSMRDALSLLDQCIAFYLNERLTYDHVLDILGAVDTTVFSRLLRSVLDQDIAGALKLIEDVVVQGRELGQFVTDFTWYLRNLMLVQSSDQLEDILDMSTENLAALKEEAARIKQAVLMRYIRIFSELTNQLRYSTQKRVLIELAVVKLCRPQMENNYESILNRLAVLEDKIENGMTFAPERPVRQAAVTEAVKAEEASALPPAQARDVEAVVGQWGKITSGLEASMMIMLKPALVSAGPDNQIILGFRQEMNKAYFDEESHRAAVEASVSEHIGKAIRIVTKLLDSGKSEETLFINPNKIRLEHVEFIDEDQF